MYTVRWNNHEGNCQEIKFKTILGAKTEAEALDLVFGGVEIIAPDGKRIWPTNLDNSSNIN